MSKQHRMYRCQNCDNVWVGEDSFSMSQCAVCRARDPHMSVSLPQSIALEMLRRNQDVSNTTFNVSKVVEDSSATVWHKKKHHIKQDFFNPQTELLTSLYVIMRRVKEKEE